MPSTASLKNTLHSLQTQYPTITFVAGTNFRWSPSQQTVTYNPAGKSVTQLLIHELSHALLGHREYARDIELLAMEMAAWEKAREIAESLGVAIQEEVLQNHLDTYRDWLHARSTCPTCSAIGFQSAQNTYSCPACLGNWRVNEARTCGLKRHKTAR